MSVEIPSKVCGLCLPRWERVMKCILYVCNSFKIHAVFRGRFPVAKIAHPSQISTLYNIFASFNYSYHTYKVLQKCGLLQRLAKVYFFYYMISDSTLNGLFYSLTTTSLVTHLSKTSRVKQMRPIFYNQKSMFCHRNQLQGKIVISYL